MPLEKAGRADKLGNRYEIHWTIFQMLNVLDEKIYSVTLEALGDDEKGTDLLIVNKDNIKEYQQCKARNASSDKWDFGTLNSKGIFKNWKYQLDRGQDRNVSLISPISCTFLVDLNNRANNTNGIPSIFYNEQILKCSKDFQNFYKNYCHAMNLNVETDNEILKSIDYLQRTFYKQWSEHEIKEWINQKICYLFSTDVSTVYDALTSIVINDSILGQELTAEKLYAILGEKEIQFRSIGIDHRIKPRFNELNEEYNAMFFPLSDGFVRRPETKKCIKMINSGESLIISGKAGYGKSGCTQEIIDYCKKENIPYIAIKLDKHVPTKTSEIWSSNLGLPEPIPHCLHKISTNEKAVIILDQLDALRWTQANSSEAITVCMEIIRQVRYLNQERENKISIIFVCRTYDLENDNNIKTLFQKNEAEKDIWKRVLIDSFDNQTVKYIVGKKYESLGIKSKELLSIPSNLYIWQQLDDEINYDDCSTTSHLIRKWYEQIKRKSLEGGVSETNIESLIEQITNMMDSMGRLYIPVNILRCEVATLDYLKSSGMLNVADNKVSFIHQSFIDYFISAKMMSDYYAGKDILNIIGDKNKQTPARRYQIQMLMQEIQSYSNEDFLNFGNKLLESNEVRYYVKYIFYELLSQIEKPDHHIEGYILSHIDDEKIVNTIVHARKNYISILRENNILDEWYGCESKRATVINLLKSINPNYDDYDVIFMRKYALNSEGEARMFSSCFWHDINSDSDSMFELRMCLYEKYPIVAKNAVIDLKKMLTNCEMRAIRLISLWMEQKNRIKEENLYSYEENLLHTDDTISISHGNDVLDELLKYIPLNIDSYFGDWSSKYFGKKNLERTCVEIIKKANIAVIKNNPQDFLRRYETYWNESELVDVFNEIVLDGFYYLPKKYSNQIMCYLIKTSKHNLIDETSGNSNKLTLLKRVLEKHTNYCNKEMLDLFITQVMQYKPLNMVEMYKQRIEQNKTKKYSPVYWTFWGDFQYEVLQSIAKNRLSYEAQSLLSQLKRRFTKLNSIYENGEGSHSGGVSSPVSGKDIGINQWVQIISNTKLNNRNRNKWIEVKGGFLESSIQMFASDFTNQVMKYPANMISIVIENKSIVLDAYINALFSGVARSELLNTLDKDLLMKMFVNFPYDLQSSRADSLCDIVSKRSDIDWPNEIYSAIIDIALNHANPDIEVPNVKKLDDKEVMPCEIIQSNAYNCVRGDASSAIGSLLWANKSLFDIFKDTIKKLSEDENIVIRYASLWPLFSAFNIDKEWASNLIIKVYESDSRLCCFHDTRHMFHIFPTQYKDRIYKIIRNCFISNEDNLIRVGAYSLLEMYFIHGAFEDVISNIEAMNKKQAQYILEMVITYFNIDKYNNHSKELILEFATKKEELGNAISRIFYDDYVDISRDKDFLLQLVKTKAGKKIISAFISYLEKSDTSIIEFADIILILCKNILDNSIEELEDIWGVEDKLSKLIINLYDEALSTDESTTFQCMELWDIMFEKQIGSIRNFSKELMDR